MAKSKKWLSLQCLRQCFLEKIPLLLEIPKFLHNMAQNTSMIASVTKTSSKTDAAKS